MPTSSLEDWITGTRLSGSSKLKWCVIIRLLFYFTVSFYTQSIVRVVAEEATQIPTLLISLDYYWPTTHDTWPNWTQITNWDERELAQHPWYAHRVEEDETDEDAEHESETREVAQLPVVKMEVVEEYTALGENGVS